MPLPVSQRPERCLLNPPSQVSKSPPSVTIHSTKPKVICLDDDHLRNQRRGWMKWLAAAINFNLNNTVQSARTYGWPLATRQASPSLSVYAALISSFDSVVNVNWKHILSLHSLRLYTLPCSCRIKNYGERSGESPWTGEMGQQTGIYFLLNGVLYWAW